MPVSQFDKDFGYLMPFLDKVAAAASGLRDAAARDELTRLIGEEKQRWARVRLLLSGAEAASATGTSSAIGVTADKPVADHSTRERPVFTVGSLRSSGAGASQLKK